MVSAAGAKGRLGELCSGPCAARASGALGRQRRQPAWSSEQLRPEARNHNRACASSEPWAVMMGLGGAVSSTEVRGAARRSFPAEDTTRRRTLLGPVGAPRSGAAMAEAGLDERRKWRRNARNRLLARHARRQRGRRATPCVSVPTRKTGGQKRESLIHVKKGSMPNE
jgi:hypothetical protein